MELSNTQFSWLEGMMKAKQEYLKTDLGAERSRQELEHTRWVASHVTQVGDNRRIIIEHNQNTCWECEFDRLPKNQQKYCTCGHTREAHDGYSVALSILYGNTASSHNCSVCFHNCSTYIEKS